MKEFWNDRYSSDEFVFGTEPNEFFKEQISNLSPGKLLLLGEGEGRNAVFAVQNGWDVHAIDWSETAQKKALSFARSQNVLFQYTVANLIDYFPENDTYDAVAMIFLHLEPELREKIHARVTDALTCGGKFIFEAYEKEQLGKSSGGPQQLDLLYSLEEIVTDFIDLKFLHLAKEKIVLNEGNAHKGEAVVVRFVAEKE